MGWFMIQLQTGERIRLHLAVVFLFVLIDNVFRQKVRKFFSSNLTTATVHVGRRSTSSPKTCESEITIPKGHDRYLALHAVSKGYEVSLVAEIFCVDESSIYVWIKKWEDEGTL